MGATKVATNGTVDTVDDETQPTFKLKRLRRERFVVPVRGTAPLIVNQWSAKAKAEMLATQQTKAKAKKAPKIPEQDYQASRYLLPDGRDGVPAVAFKAAIVHAARLFDKSLTQVFMKQTILVGGEGPQMLVPIIGDISMREDTPRNSNGSPDLRYRAQFWPWEATLHVVCVEGQFDQDSVLALVDAAGIGGIGEWRPTSPKSATGTYGTFEVVAE